jgi:hypothetical protein
MKKIIKVYLPPSDVFSTQPIWDVKQYDTDYIEWHGVLNDNTLQINMKSGTKISYHNCPFTITESES